VTRFLAVFWLALLALAAPVAASQGKSATSEGQLAQTPAGEVRLIGRVVDQAGIIPVAAEAALEGMLGSLEQETSDQLVVVTLPSLGGAKIEDVAQRLGHGWGIGRADLDNGVLLLVAPTERKVRIHVGYGLEGLLTDARAAEIIAAMLPLFRQGRPVDAIHEGTARISMLLVSDKRRPQRIVAKVAA
jgi:uncharacterized protein